MTALNPSHRPLIMGRRGVVASNHPSATDAGLAILRAGGNAFDAAVAISLALGVAEPAMSGLGGDGFYHVYLADTGLGHVYNGTGAAPRSATVESYARDGIPLRGPRSVSVPGAIGALEAMHRAHGNLPWKRLCEPAIALAFDGFIATRSYCRFISMWGDQLDTHGASILMPTGDIPDLGAIVVQSALGRTLEAIATGGAETFYRGDLGRKFVRACGEAGVPLSSDDLASCRPEIQQPIAIDYRGYQIRQTPPNSTGFVLLQEMKILEQFVLATLGDEAATFVHILIEAKKRAFRDCERFATDPRFGEIPLDRLLSDGYAKELAATINLDKASEVTLRERAYKDGDTTYFAVVDREGNAVSAIQSLNNGFGSGVIAGDTGILLNNRMAYWHLDPTHPNYLKAGKRVRHTMNAPIVLRSGRPWAIFGTPGGDDQVQVNMQTLVGLIDLGLDPQQVAEAPRWRSGQRGQEANWPHADEDIVTMESNFAQSVIAGLRDRGHSVQFVPPLGARGSVSCLRLLENGVCMAGSDPRRDGWAGAL